MMVRVVALLCGGALLAQTPFPAEGTKQQAAAQKESPPLSINVTKPAVCAIPLINALRLAKPEPMPQIKPPATPRFFIQQIHPPAPSCDDEAGRRYSTGAVKLR